MNKDFAILNSLARQVREAATNGGRMDLERLKETRRSSKKKEKKKKKKKRNRANHL